MNYYYIYTRDYAYTSHPVPPSISRPPNDVDRLGVGALEWPPPLSPNNLVESILREGSELPFFGIYNNTIIIIYCYYFSKLRYICKLIESVWENNYTGYPENVLKINR